MRVDFYLEDGTLLGASGFELGALQAATESDPLVLYLGYRYGEPADGDRLQDLVLRLATEDPLRAGVGVMQGVPPQDQQWARVRFVGHDNGADPTQEDFRTDWRPLGAYLGIPFPSLHAGCRRRTEWVWRPSLEASGAWVFLPSVYASEHSIALPGPPTVGGILTGAGDRGRSSIVRGGELRVSEVPDDQVHVAPRQVLADGELLGQAEQSLQLDRTDGDGTALADGDVYRVRVVATEAGAVARRGVVALEPSAPPLEPGDLGSLGVLRVEAPAGGGPVVIEAEDLEAGPVWDRFRVEVVPGRLEVRVHAGEAIGGGSWRFWQRVSDPVPLSADQVHWLWQLADGRFEVTTSPAARSSTALGPWAEIETDTVEAIRLQDRRALAAALLPLTASGTVTGEGAVTRLHIPAPLQIDEVLVSLDAEPSGLLAFDIVEAGASRLVAGTEPAFDVGSPLLSRSAIFEGGRCHVGTVLELQATSAPASPVGFTCTLLGLGA